MDLYGMVYVSKEEQPFSDSMLEELSLFASQQNHKFNITGYLYYEKGIFIQYIEGQRLDAQQLFRNIEKDVRHKVLNIQTDQTLVKRKFPNWGMHRLQKKALAKINMEFVLIDYMMHCARTQNLSLNKETIWRMVNKLSILRTRLE